MKNKSIKNKGDKSALDQAGMSNTHYFDDDEINITQTGQTDTPVTPQGQIPEVTQPTDTGLIPQVPQPTGGVVIAGKTDTPKKSFSNDVRKTVVESEAATLRKQAQQLRAAAKTCSFNIANLGWSWCYVAVPFENNKEIAIEEAVRYAKKLDQKALMTAIDAAIRTPGATGPLSCNLFAGAVGKELDIPYFRNPIDDDHHMADNMYGFISGAVNSSASGWVNLDEDRVQDIADEGRFVVGVAHSTTSEHGHIVIAVSSDLPKANDHGRNIPCVLDGQHAKEKVSIVPSMVFGSSVSKPIWAFYKD